MHEGFTEQCWLSPANTAGEKALGYPSLVPLEIIMNHIFILLASPLVDLVPIVSIWVSGGKVWENSSASVDLEYGH